MTAAQTSFVPKPSARQSSPDRYTLDKSLRESIERDYNRVLQWHKWRTAPLRKFLETFEAMIDEEEFALQWLETQDVTKTVRIEEIHRVYSYRITHRSLGKDKAPLVVPLHKPPMDPATEAELKQLRYIMLLSKIKAQMAEDHPRDPKGSASGTKDVHGNEIEEEDEEESEDENNEEENKDENNDDETEDDNNEDLDEASSKNPVHSSRAIIPQLNESVQQQHNLPAHEDRKEASPEHGHSMHGENPEAPHHDEHRNSSPTHIEDDSIAESPRTIMNLMRETVHSAELIHKQYLALREKDPRVLNDLCQKVNLLLDVQSQPQQSNPSHDKTLKQLVKRVSDLEESSNKVARQQHEIKHSHYGLKERVDLACTKIDTYQDNSYQLGEYALQILGYAQDILLAIRQIPSVPPTACADDAKKGENRDDDRDKDDDNQPRRDNTKERSSEKRVSPHKVSGHSHPPPKSRGQSHDQRRYGRTQDRPHKARQSFGSEAKNFFTGLSRRDQVRLRQRLMKNTSVTMDGIGNFVDYVPYEEGSAFKVHKESGKSYQEGMNSFELISWWKSGVVEGNNIREAYNNYTSLNIKGGYEELVRNNPIRTFKASINKKIDYERTQRRQEEKDNQERKKEAQQRLNLLEILTTQSIGSNNELGREIEEDESAENEEEDEDDNDDVVDDADDEHDDNDDDDDDNDDQLGNATVQETDPEDSDPILIGPDYDTFPQRSPLKETTF
ncbi:PREDICTED: glutamic acid-rich protein-like [Ipomoea nil]|uniref:glutamic acid-rich protein-like n=1 Tax=Ipomoea nil TaxID=35883 RepID=UPI0009014114|nr:PREDICTED: glutamic acid-rich protein-like [Ipomoea nil]